MLGYLIILVVLAAVFALITGPLRSTRGERSDLGVTVADLEAARDAKYREIHDAEMDLRTGKLSEHDHREIDAALRAEAIDILHRLDAARAEAGGELTAGTLAPSAPDTASRLPSAP